jgi:putative transcriptional regulator
MGTRQRSARRALAKALDLIERTRSAMRGRKPNAVDVAGLRRRLQMSQAQFARRFGFSVATLRHWERGDRKPRGPALVLLNVIAHNHRVVLMALSPPPRP